ncbi:MAG: glycosyltransferase [Acidobacteria bacterium]|nr:glycosyltransferase [Acidobacteriota bacterium]
MKLALVSPLPPAPSGVADFSARLAEGLRRYAEVDAFADPSGVDLAGYDRRLYQVGNNPLHGPAYDAALRAPGAVELHDAVLHHFLLGRLDEAAYVEEVVANLGEWFRHKAHALWARRAQSGGDEEFFRYPLLGRIAAAAERIIVHNPAAARLAQTALAGAPTPVFEIPHFVDPAPAAPADRLAALRRGLGAEGSTLLLGCFGYQRPTKRLRSVIAAARRLPSPWKLLVAGSFVSADYQASIEPWLSDPRVVQMGRLSAQELAEYAAAVDVCVNLRWPAAGETSGIAMRLLAAGRCVVVTDSQEWASFPEGALVRIDAGPAEEDMLAAQLELLARRPELRRAIAAAGQTHVLQRHHFDRVLELYRQALVLS